MNRSLEALAIFTICLGGILAAVRISTHDSRPAGRNVAERAKTEAAPPKTSGTAIEPREIDECELAYELGCGFDRLENRVYAPCGPLLSPAEFARRAIRSAPIPLIVLPDAELLAGYEQSLTGYDTAYDKAVFGIDRGPLALADYERSLTGYDAVYDDAVFGSAAGPDELDYDEIEAEYAAAELAAAAEGAARGTYSSLSATTVARPASPTWLFITGRVASLLDGFSQSAEALQRRYVEPISRGVGNRWSHSELPKLLEPARGRAGGAPLLLRQRADSDSAGRIGWEDYLDFAERHLPVLAEQELAERVARQKAGRTEAQ